MSCQPVQKQGGIVQTRVVEVAALGRDFGSVWCVVWTLCVCCCVWTAGARCATIQGGQGKPQHLAGWVVPADDCSKKYPA